MVISSKTEEPSLPITPAAPAPCTDRMSSPFPRKQERAGGGRGSVHRTSPGSHPPALQGQLLPPRPLPRMAIAAPSPGTAWAGARDAGCGMGMRDAGCSGGPAGRPGCSRRGWGGAAQPPPPAASPGAPQAALAPGIPSPQPEHPSSPAHSGGRGGGGAHPEPGASLPSGSPPTLLLTRMRGK